MFTGIILVEVIKVQPLTPLKNYSIFTNKFCCFFYFLMRKYYKNVFVIISVF